MRKLKLGQKVKAKFLTIVPASETRGTGHAEHKLPIRDGIVTYIHPFDRYVCVSTLTPQGYLTEAFKPWEVIA